MGKTIYVTGADEKYFSMACALSQSFSIFCPTEPLYVCDFGLSSSQREFLEDKGLLLRASPELKEGTHPFVYKASLIKFIANLTYDSVVWIDSDCLLLAPIKNTLERFLKATSDGEILAVCENVGDQSIDDFLGRYSAGPFKDRLEDFGVSGTKPYLNSGFFLVRSSGFLERWCELTREMEEHMLFEQNAFNLLAHGENRGLTLLDNMTWNAHHRYLAEMELIEFAPEVKGFFLGKRQVAVAHATSSREGDIEQRDFTLRVENKRFQGFLKFIVNPALREYQELAIQGFLLSNRAKLREFDLLKPA